MGRWKRKKAQFELRLFSTGKPTLDTGFDLCYFLTGPAGETMPVKLDVSLRKCGGARAVVCCPCVVQANLMAEHVHLKGEAVAIRPMSPREVGCRLKEAYESGIHHALLQVSLMCVMRFQPDEDWETKGIDLQQLLDCAFYEG
jgi:hypothetical protein